MSPVEDTPVAVEGIDGIGKTEATEATEAIVAEEEGADVLMATDERMVGAPGPLGSRTRLLVRSVSSDWDRQSC